MSKNLTTIVKHPLSKKDVAGYIYEIGETDEHYITRCPGGGTAIYTGPILDRLHEFEKLGLEPEEISSLMAAHSELLEKCAPKKVLMMETEFREGYSNPIKIQRYTYVRETRKYACPNCRGVLLERYKITKLYPNRTIGTEQGESAAALKDRCTSCGQPLDWSDVDKETWS